MELGLGTVKLKSLRILRVLRPLKTINAIPSKRQNKFKGLTLVRWYRYEEVDFSYDSFNAGLHQRWSLLHLHHGLIRHYGSSSVQ
jgi:hypothetical protein